jgi:hypothetical protein
MMMQRPFCNFLQAARAVMSFSIRKQIFPVSHLSLISISTAVTKRAGEHLGNDNEKISFHSISRYYKFFSCTATSSRRLLESGSGRDSKPITSPLPGWEAVSSGVS